MSIQQRQLLIILVEVVVLVVELEMSALAMAAQRRVVQDRELLEVEEEPY